MNGVTGSNNNLGLFGATGGNAVISNLGVAGTITNGGNNVGGVVAVNQGEIVNSYSRVNVTASSGSSNVGSLVGVNSGASAVITNSYVLGDVTG